MRKRWPLFLFIELLQQRLPVLWEVWAWFAALAQKVRPDRITVNALPTLTATVWAWFLLVCFFFFDTGNMAIIEIIKNFKWYLYKWFLNGENQIYWNNFQIHSTMQKLSNMIQVQVNILRSLRCHRNFYTIPTENKGPFFFLTRQLRPQKNRPFISLDQVCCLETQKDKTFLTSKIIFFGPRSR